MVIQKSEYSKKFLSKTIWEDISPHGSSRWKYSQTVSDNDIKLRELIINKFGLKSNINTHYWTGEAEGYDGNFYYTFNFSSDFSKADKKDPEKNINYDSTIKIKKASSILSEKTKSDLEHFLLSEGFEKSK